MKVQFAYLHGQSLHMRMHRHKMDVTKHTQRKLHPECGLTYPQDTSGCYTFVQGLSGCGIGHIIFAIARML